jgi:hypothetical protein
VFPDEVFVGDDERTVEHLTPEDVIGGDSDGVVRAGPDREPA